MSPYKNCKVCGKEFEYKSKRSHPPDFCSNKCREEHKREYTKNYRSRIDIYQKYIETHRRIRKQRKLRCLHHYGGNPSKCACCGEDHIEFLSIDHIHGGGLRHIKKIRTQLYYWLIKNNFPEGFQVLCFNCNRAKGHQSKVRFCPVHHPELYKTT